MRCAGVLLRQNGAVLCKTIHACTDHQIREDQNKTIANLRRCEFYDETTDERLDKSKIAEAWREKIKYFEAVGVYKKAPCAEAIDRTGRRPMGIKWVYIKKGDTDVTGAGWWPRSSTTELTKQCTRRPLKALKLLTVMLAARERERRNANIADVNSSVMMHVDVHRTLRVGQSCTP